MKRILTLLFALVAISASAFEQGDFAYTIQSDGTARINGFKSSYSGSPTTLTIPGYVYDSGTQKYYQVKSIQNSAFRNKKSLTKVTIQYGVEDILSYAFAECPNLKTIYLPSSIKSLANRVFDQTPLTYVNCAAEVMPSITEYALAGMTSASGSRSWSCATPEGKDAADAVTRITSNFTTGWNASAADISDQTFGSSSANTLCNVYLNITEGWNPSTQNYGKAKLLTATPSSSNSSGTLKFDYNQSIMQGYAHFYVTEISGSFRYNGTRIKVLDMSQTSKVEKIGAQAFYNCTNLTQAKVTAKVIEGSAFNYCTNLASVQLYGTSESNCVQSLGTFAFARTKVSSIYIPAGLTSYGAGAFAYCTNLSSISVSSSNSTFATHAATPGCLYNKAKTILYQAAGKFGDTSFADNAPETLNNISAYAFAGNTGMESLDVPYGVKTIGSYAFAETSNLISLSIPRSVTTFSGNTFVNMSSLTQLSFNHTTIPSTLTGSAVFYGIKSGCKLRVPRWRKGHYQANSVWKSAFSGGISESSFDFKQTFEGNVLYFTVTSTASYTDDLVQAEPTDGQVMLVDGGYEANSLSETLTLPDMVTYRGRTFMVTEIERETFIAKGDNGLVNVKGGAGIKKIGAKAFFGIQNTTTNRGYFSIPNPVEFGDSALSGFGIQYLTIGNRLERIGAYAFAHCSLIQQGTPIIYLPPTVTEIGDEAFSGAGFSLKVMITRTEKTILGHDIFEMFGNAESNHNILYVPLNLYLYYKNQTQSWLLNPENRRHLLPWYRPETKWSLISIPESGNFKIPYGNCYVINGYDKSVNVFKREHLGEDPVIPGNTGILFKGTPGTRYKLEQPSPSDEVCNPSVNYLVAPQGESEYFSTSQGKGLVYVLDGAAEMFRLQDATIYSGGAALRIPQSVFGTDTPPSNVDADYNYPELDLYINGVRVTEANAGDLSVIDGVSGDISFDFATNTLKMNNATITSSDENCIQINSDGIIIDLQGVNTLNRGSGEAHWGNSGILIFGNYKKLLTTIRNSGTLNVSHPTGFAIRVYNGILTIADGAQVNLTGKYGLYGCQFDEVTLLMRGANTKLVSNGTIASVSDVHKVQLLDDLAITEPAGTHLDNHIINDGNRDFFLANWLDADGNIIKDRDVVISKPTTPLYPKGDINCDGKVDMNDLNILVDIILDKAQPSSYQGDADVNGDTSVNIVDVNMLINIILER